MGLFNQIPVTFTNREYPRDLNVAIFLVDQQSFSPWTVLRYLQVNRKETLLFFVFVFQIHILILGVEVPCSGLMSVVSVRTNTLGHYYYCTYCSSWFQGLLPVWSLTA